IAPNGGERRAGMGVLGDLVDDDEPAIALERAPPAAETEETPARVIDLKERELPREAELRQRRVGFLPELPKVRMRDRREHLLLRQIASYGEGPETVDRAPSGHLVMVEALAQVVLDRAGSEHGLHQTPALDAAPELLRRQPDHAQPEGIPVPGPQIYRVQDDR